MEEEQTKHENWMKEYNRANERRTIEKMKKHLVEYVTFYTECHDKSSIDVDEIPLLWTTWCIRRGIK